MSRAAIALLLVAAACGSKKAKEPPAETPAGSAVATGSGSAVGSGSVGSGSAAATTSAPGPVSAPALRWLSPAGDPLLALGTTGTLEGPCGPVGGATATEVVIEGQKFTWTGVERKGRAYQIAPLPWTIEVADSGTVTLTNPGKPAVALGTVTGTNTEEGARWFAALVIAAPALQLRLGLTTADGKVTYALSASADLAAWTVKQGSTIVAKKLRDQTHGVITSDAAEGLAPGAVTVASGTPRTYDVTVAGAVYGAGAYTVTEDDKGALAWKPAGAAAAAPLGTLVGRVACAPHDKAAAALIETLLSTKSGFAATRAAETTWSGKK